MSTLERFPASRAFDDMPFSEDCAIPLDNANGEPAYIRLRMPDDPGPATPYPGRIAYPFMYALCAALAIAGAGGAVLFGALLGYSIPPAGF